MKIDLVPMPKKIIPCHGNLVVPVKAGTYGTCILISDDRAHTPADLLAEKFEARVVSGSQAGGTCIRLNIVKELDFARKLRADLCVEAYCLEVTSSGINISALTAEGLLRAAATLLQLRHRGRTRWVFPCVVIKDWPNFRYRCAADWLLNVECNRWAYDWGDGRAAFMKRTKHELDFCFEHKINMVWFDGFGWDTKRFPGYAQLMNECNRYARRLGIKLEFGGYGGGYGTAYQSGEIYRCGYFGKVFFNRRPYPGGKKYACRGWRPEGRASAKGGGRSCFYGTCLSNMPLRTAKIEEMKRFVAEVNPGLIYIHDIDAGTWQQSLETWKNRCAVCRKRWPNDDLAAEDGQAGAFASWFRQVRRELSAVPCTGDYLPARDLTVAFVSPLYTHYTEKKPKNVWELEKRYYDKLSRLIGPEPGIEFGFREMFYDRQGRKKMAGLRAMLDRNGNGHGILVIAFGGGDNYISDDLANISGAMAHFYDGAETVCLSNGGLHEEPVQVMNADFLWSGCAGKYLENPADEKEAEAVFAQIACGKREPVGMFSSGGYFEKICVRLWGKDAGKLMRHAILAKHDQQPSVSRVWWTITKSLAELNVDPASASYCIGDVLAPTINSYADRRLASGKALEYARQAEKISDSENIRWFVKCLEIGKRFAGALDLLFRLRLGNDKTADVRLDCLIKDLKARIRKMGVTRKVDVLGGDPGCWLETIAEIQRLGKFFARQNQNGVIFSDFIHKWRVSQAIPSAGNLNDLKYPGNKNKLHFTRRFFSGAFCDMHENLVAGARGDAAVYYACRVNCAEPMKLELRLGYDGPVKAWLDRRQVFYEPNGTNPARGDAALVPWEATKGNHELMIALGSNKGKACGIFARFRRVDIPVCRKKTGTDKYTMVMPGA